MSSGNLLSNTDHDVFKVIMISKNKTEERTISIKDENGELFDLEALKSKVEELLKSQKDILEDRYNLGLGMVGDSSKAYGFVIGWIVSRLLLAHENSNDCKLDIDTSKRDISRDEIFQYAIDESKATTKYLENSRDNPDIVLTDLPNKNIGDISDDFQ